MMRGAVQSLVLQLLSDQLNSKNLVDFIRGCNMEKEVKMLEKTLRNVNSFLNDAENKQYNDELVKQWLDDLRDAAYDAEDVIDDIATEALQQKLKSESQTSSSMVYRSFVQLLDFPSKTLSKITKVWEIKAITGRFEELERERSQLGLEEIVAGSSRSIAFRERSSVVDESHILGRGDDKARIINLLLKEEESAIYGNELVVIPIVGMGGLGKTTLAQLVYNDNRVKDHFNLKAWVCISTECDVTIITRSIIESITYQTCHLIDLDQLQVTLKEALTGMKFLLVLDDVWNLKYDDWVLLRKPFGVGAPGSAIIVTTRNGEIGSNMGTIDNHSLKMLSEDDCWSVFVQHAFGPRTVDVNPDLSVTGKKIVGKCHGLPLAAKSLGGLLRSKEGFEWENVLNSEIWDLPEQETGLLPVLKSSYYYLPSYLKRCFAYCSIFPKGYEIQTENLVLLWMAEGFLKQPNGKMEPEDFGRKCFCELLSMSFFQPSSTNKSSFVMHDLMSDLAQWAAGHTCFRVEDLSDRNGQCKFSKKARHSSYISGNYDGVRKFEEFYEHDCLRTFLPLNIKGFGHHQYLSNNVTFDLLPKLKFLRVLSLRGYRFTQLPSSVGDSKHLRYLDLSYTNIKNLPESVSTLFNLQTLLLNTCSRLKKLPEEMQNLINLRHFDISKDLIEAMPPQIGRLTSLRKLSDFVVGKDSGCGIGELTNLKHLEGTLRISMLENVMDAHQARVANLSDKKGLNVLVMEWCSRFDDRPSEMVEKEVLDMLRPHEKLKELTIKCYGGPIFPKWIGDVSFSSMVFLKLEDCERCTDLPPLGQLPLLKDLCIRRMNGIVTVGPGFYGEGCSNPFPSLETLNFEDMKEWRDWLPCVEEKRDNLFALLHVLSLERCPNLLGSLPDHLPSLEKLQVCDCKRLTVTISRLPKLCKLELRACQEVAQRSNINLSSLKSMDLSDIPRWIEHASFSSMVFVELEGCERCTDLPPLGQLPLLKDLCIRRMNGVVTVGPGFYGEGCSNPFPSLETLSFEDMKEWRDWLPCVEEMRENLFALLRVLSLERCPNLLGSLPDHLPSLEKLQVCACKRLTVTISRLPKLCKLELRACQEVAQRSNVNLSSLKSINLEHVSITESLIQGSSTVEDLEIFGCDELVSFWQKEKDVSLLQPLTSLDSLIIRSFHKLENLQGLHNLASLRELTIKGCPRLVSLPERSLPAMLQRLEIRHCNALESISDAISWHYSSNLSLEYLGIEGCCSLTSISTALLFSTVKQLKIYFCNALESLLKEDEDDDDDDKASSSSHFSASSSSSLRSVMRRQDSNKSRRSLLEFLHIMHCPSLTSLFSSSSSRPEELPTTLKTLWIWDCPKLGSIGEIMHNNSSIELIRISNCGSLESLQENLVRFPDGILLAANLRVLEINHCPDIIVSFPKEEGLPTNITKLQISGHNIFQPLFEWSLHRLASLRQLRELDIEGCGCTDMVLPSSLIKLVIRDFWNLERLSSKGFQNLTCLEELRIQNCPKLQSLPEKGLLPSLLQLDICRCPLLKQRCKRDQGQDSPNISHVPCIRIDNRFIYDLDEEK